MCGHLRSVAQWVEPSEFEKVNALAANINIDKPSAAGVVGEAPDELVQELIASSDCDSLSDLPPPPARSASATACSGESMRVNEDGIPDFDSLLDDSPELQPVAIQGGPYHHPWETYVIFGLWVGCVEICWVGECVGFVLTRREAE
jgi:hypothetical protein